MRTVLASLILAASAGAISAQDFVTSTATLDTPGQTRNVLITEATFFLTPPVADSSMGEDDSVATGTFGYELQLSGEMNATQIDAFRFTGGGAVELSDVDFFLFATQMINGFEIPLYEVDVSTADLILTFATDDDTLKPVSNNSSTPSDHSFILSGGEIEASAVFPVGDPIVEIIDLTTMPFTVDPSPGADPIVVGLTFVERDGNMDVYNVSFNIPLMITVTETETVTVNSIPVTAEISVSVEGEIVASDTIMVERILPDDCPADTNDDNMTDSDDFFAVIQFFGTGTTIEQGNFDGDAVTDADDFFLVIQFFGCGTGVN